MPTLIPGATASTYVLTDTDIGEDIFCRVTGTNSVGASSANSNTVGPVEATAPFTPADLTGLIAWYDATAGVYNDAGTTLATNGQTVQQWNDQSGGNYHLLGTSNKPTYNTTGFNSLPAIVLAAGNFLATTADSVVQGGGTLLSVFVVGQMGASTPGVARLFSYVGNGLLLSEDYIDIASAAALLTIDVTNISAYRGAQKSTSTISTATNYRFGSIFDGTNHTVFVNNTGGTPVASTGNFTSPGRIYLANAGWVGPVAEIVVTSTALDSTARTQLDDYFKTKWGLS